MGIELPAELADVAAAAGVRWPRADEDAMRATAQAWRQAGIRTSTLAVDADHTAGRALSVVQGTAGTAANRHWQTFVAPDTGHLSRATQGCLDAADRLDHAADQVGAAKVQIVRHLVTLAQHTDAANQAAAAGHPSALAGLPVAVQGTAVNVAHVNHTLTNSIALPTSPAQAVGPHAQPALSPAAAHGGGPLGHTVDAVVGSDAQPVLSPGAAHGGPLGHAVDAAAGSVAQPLTSAGGTLLGAAGGVPDHIGPPGVPDHVGPPGGLPDHVGPPGGMPDHLGPTGTAPIPAGPPSAGPSSVISPDPTLGANQPVGHPAPPLPGTPSAPDVTTAQSAAPSVAPPPVATAPPVVPPAQPTGSAPAQNTIWPAAPDPAPIAGPAPTIPGPAPTAGPAPSAGVPIAGPAPAAGPAPTNAAIPAAGPAPTPAGNGPSAAIGAVTTAPPPRSGARPAVSPPPTIAAPPAPPPPRDELALFLMYLFPDGHRPGTANRPISRQLPPPPPDVDFAAGLRFPPHDHPESHRIGAEPPGEPVPPTPPQPVPADLTDGYDPLGYENQNERDWDRRFVVRAGIPTEYAWPLFQEGGCTDGEPVVLEPGTTVDRFGTPEGRVFSAAGTPYARRGLPPGHLDAGYRRYRVTRELPVWRTLSAPWFGQPGGGTRLRSVYPAADLVAFGYLAEETHGQ